MTPERVVVGVDFDTFSLKAARWATGHFAPDAEPVLVHVLDVRDPPRYLGDDADIEELLEEGREEGARRLQGVAKEIGGSPGTEVRAGRPDEVLSEVAQEVGADLIAVGRGAGDEGVLGGTAERLLNSASVPVLMVPASTPGGLEEILVAVDDSPETAEVLSWACALAKRHRARAAVAHVFQPTFAGLGGLVSGGASRRVLEEKQERQARAWLKQCVQDAGFDADRVTTEIREGDPAEQILSRERAPEPDLIVTGSRGAGAVQKTLLGSVASSVLRAASAPVLVVRRG